MMKLKKDPTPPLDWIPHVMILARALVVMILVLVLSVGIKAFVNERLTLQDDAHMTELLRAKFSDYESMSLFFFCCCVVLIIRSNDKNVFTTTRVPDN